MESEGMHRCLGAWLQARADFYLAWTHVFFHAFVLAYLLLYYDPCRRAESY